MKKNTVFIIITSVLTLFVAFGVFFLIQELRKISVNKNLPQYAQIRGFSLVDQFGKVFHSEKLEKKIWVLNFICTSCDDMSDELTKNMSALARSFEMSPEVEVVSMTVDPEEDTPDVLLDYSKQFIINKERWHFLTGEQDYIYNFLVNQLSLELENQNDFSTNQFVLVDPNKVVRGYYDGDNQKEINELFVDINLLLKNLKKK